jgi:hypothetical protein
MPKFKFDDVEYDTDNLSDEAKAQLESLIFSEQQLRRLSMEVALTQTARNGYLRALKETLPNASSGDPKGEKDKASTKK